MSSKTLAEPKGGGVLGFIERAGNKLPHPVLLFVYFCAIVILFSFIGSLLGWSAVHPVDGTVYTVFNLISKEGIAKMFTQFSANIKSFSALIDQLVILLGLSLLEGTGLASAFLRRYFLKMPKKALTLAVTFIAVLSSAASDAGFMILPPLVAMLFMATGRNPIAGIVAAYGSVAAGFCSSPIISIVEVVGFGNTQNAAQIIDPSITLPLTGNYFFTLTCSLILPLVSFFVTLKIVEPRLGKYDPAEGSITSLDVNTQLTEDEERGLKAAGIALIIYAVVIALMTFPKNAILRGADGGILNGPFMNSILLIITGAFFFPGVAYGMKAKVCKNHKDIIEIMTNGYSSLAGYILVAVFAGQLMQYFSWTNLGIICAINGADWIQSLGVPVFALLVFVVLFTALLNFLMPSHAAKLAFMGPVIVPLFMMLNVSPEATYLAYRIGDSVTNAITPMMGYFVLILAWAQRYKKDVGMGTLISNLLPYSVWYLVTYLVLMAVWYFLGLPLGPGVGFAYGLG